MSSSSSTSSTAAQPPLPLPTPMEARFFALDAFLEHYGDRPLDEVLDELDKSEAPLLRVFRAWRYAVPVCNVVAAQRLAADGRVATFARRLVIDDRERLWGEHGAKRSDADHSFLANETMFADVDFFEACCHGSAAMLDFEEAFVNALLSSKVRLLNAVRDRVPTLSVTLAIRLLRGVASHKQDSDALMRLVIEKMMAGEPAWTDLVDAVAASTGRARALLSSEFERRHPAQFDVVTSMSAADFGIAASALSDASRARKRQRSTSVSGPVRRAFGQHVPCCNTCGHMQDTACRCPCC